MTQAAMGQIACAGCSRSYKWKPELAGKKGKCKCGEFLNFPVDDPSRQGGVAEAAGEYDLNEPVAAPKPKVAAATKVVAGSTACKGCTVMIPPGAVICTRCGMNQTTGKKISTMVKGASPETGDVVKKTAGIMLALVVGGITSLVCAGIWIAIIFMTGFTIGFMATGIGLATGGVMRLVNRGGGHVVGVMAAVFAVLSLVIVKGVLMGLLVMANQSPLLAFRLFDVLWAVLAISAAYRIGSNA
jgi:RNA polymerase subunit RPABC4/transcription elongation factor Spt4